MAAQGEAVGTGMTEERESADVAQAEDAFVRCRPRLFAVAHRILGSVADAEDVVQEAWLRWAAVDIS